MFDGLTITDLGVVGVFVILLLREIRSLIETHWTGAAAASSAASSDAGDRVTTSSQVRGKIHQMHEVVTLRGADGVPLVYRHPETDKALAEIAANTELANQHLQAIRDRGGAGGS